MASALLGFHLVGSTGRGMIRGPGPEPEATQGGPAAHRARAQRSNHRYQHDHQPIHFHRAVIPHNCQQHAGFTHHDPAVVAAHDPEAKAERERLAAVQRALNGDNPYKDLVDQGINLAFFGVTAPTT